MKVLGLLEEIEEIVETASGVPLTGKIMVDGSELIAIVKEIRTELPDEIQQAQWIKNERDRILGEAKSEYVTIINEARRQAEDLIDHDVIMVRAKNRASELMNYTEENIHRLKMSTYDYVDGILFNFQEKMDELSSAYFSDMFNKLEDTFNSVNETLSKNRDEIKEMAYKTSMNMDEVSEQRASLEQKDRENFEEEEYEKE
ncbi:MAG: ATPase [Anaerovoracaceae bacterium]